MIPINIQTSSLKGVRWYQGFQRIKQVTQVILLLVAGACFLLRNKCGDYGAAVIITSLAIGLVVVIEVTFRILAWIIKGFLPQEKPVH